MRKSDVEHCIGRVVEAIGTIIHASVVLVSIACLPSTAAETGKQSAAFKGHQLEMFITDPQARRATIELDNRSIAVQEDVAEIGKINTYDLGSSVLFSLHVKTVAGCGSYIIVHVSLAAGSDKNEVLSDFGACNDRLTMRVETRQGWSAWYAFAFRDDRATAQAAFIRDDKLATQEVKAPPCLFTAVVEAKCMDSLVADAVGSGELGVPTGDGSLLNQKIETFLNRGTGKATVKLNGRVFRTFDDAKEFYLAAVEGEDQFGLFEFFLRPTTGCSTRPLVFFPRRGSEPQVIADYAPCTDKIIRLKRKKADTIEWSGIAFHLGEPGGYIASVADHKISTRTALLPACMMGANTLQDKTCALQALGAAAAPQPTKPPRLEPIPAPPSAGHKPSREMRGI